LICGCQKGLYDIFALVIKLATKTYCNWAFEASNTSRHALAKDLIELVGKYDLRKKTLLMLKMKDLI
jgi:hypothetical protein